MNGRADALDRLATAEWDLLVVGGGITGAGVAREAARRGWRVALVEQRDFAWGTSSRSSKLVHGGLRYLAQGHFGLTLESVCERERLLREAPELIEVQRFLVAHGTPRDPGRSRLGLGLAIYDAMAGVRSRGWVDREALAWLVPGLAPAGLTGATTYHDARVDDARLVWRVLAEARRDGALTLNHVAASAPVVQQQRVRGLALHDAETGRALVARAKAVVNATGVWTDRLRAGLGGRPMIRPLRGSHLIVDRWRLPVALSVSLMHPADGRPVFFFPWEGATLIGTTDLDHHGDLGSEAAITPAETDYLLAAVDSAFPRAGLTEADVIACYAGVRPIVDLHRGRPSDAPREHAVIDESGLVTVCGGKLTTFRTMAQQALALAARLIDRPCADLDRDQFVAVVGVPDVDSAVADGEDFRPVRTPCWRAAM